MRPFPVFPPAGRGAPATGLQALFSGRFVAVPPVPAAVRDVWGLKDVAFPPFPWLLPLYRVVALWMFFLW